MNFYLIKAAYLCNMSIYDSNKIFMTEVVVTEDGSPTLWIEEYSEPYHSLHGAVQEAMHVFIHTGLGSIASARQTIHILEVGFGTGLNALLTWDYAQLHKLPVSYTGTDPFLPPPSLLKGLNYPVYCRSPYAEQAYAKILSSFDGSRVIKIDELFSLQVIQEDFRKISYPDESYDCVFFDAFRPEIVPELWEKQAMQFLYNALSRCRILVTYSTKGQVRRNLSACGFLVEKVPGPPGKREITLARK